MPLEMQTQEKRNFGNFSVAFVDFVFFWVTCSHESLVSSIISLSYCILQRLSTEVIRLLQPVSRRIFA